MSNTPENNTAETEYQSYLPDFCDGDTFLRLLLVVELIAIVFALVSFSSGSLFIHIALISIVVLWVGLTDAAILCWLMRQNWLSSHLSTSLTAISVTLAMTLLVSLLSLGFGAMLVSQPAFFGKMRFGKLVFK